MIAVGFNGYQILQGIEKNCLNLYFVFQQQHVYIYIDYDLYISALLIYTDFK